MRRRAIIGALLLVGVGVFLGGTLLQDQIASARALAQDVFVNNTAANPVPVREQGTVNVNVGRNSSDREPYQQTMFFNQTEANCESLGCVVTFPAVPTGKRLVITYVSASYGLTVGGSFPRVTVRSSSVSDPSILLPAPVNIGGESLTASAPVTFYVEAGAAPIVRLGGQFVAPVSQTATASVVGYLVPTT